MRLKQKYIGLLMIFPFCWWSGLASGWNYTGHLIVAEIAYQQLDAKAQQYWQNLTQVLADEPPATMSLVKSAMWPDWIKSHGHNEFNHWHYINLPFTDEPEYMLPHSAQQEATESVVWAIENSRVMLVDEHTSVREKAFHLRFLMHLVADVHQPLHATSLYNSQFPEGDKGGNLFAIESPLATNLHQLWDRGLGYFKQYQGHGKIKRYAQSLQADYPPEFFGDRITDDNIPGWATESAYLAQHYVYQIAPGDAPSDAYLQQGITLTQQQLALAGYRLAVILSDISAS